jgi:tetratricopeptide (TPR) repeat protein
MLNYNSEEIRSSITKFEQMLKTNHTYFFDAQEFEDIVVHYLGFGDHQLAKSALKIGMEQHPSNLELILLQSEVFILDEKFDLAIDLLDYVENILPQNEEIALQKATISSKKGNHKDSIELLHIALERSEDPFEIWNLLGMEHLLAEEYEQAEYFFKNCLTDNPEDYPSLYNLLYCYEQLNKDEEAIKSLNEVLQSDPFSEIAWHQLGKVLSKVGKIKEALSAYDFAIISDDTFTGAYIEKGKILESIGRINEAIENYEVALNTTDPSAFVFQRIGKCHEKLDNSRLALQFYLKSINAEPSNEKSWESLINFYIQQKNLDKAKHYLTNALEVNNDSIRIWTKSIDLYDKLNDKEKTIESYQKIIELGVFDIRLIKKYIDLLISCNNWSKAYEIAKKGLEYFPENNDLKLRIGGCCINLNRKKEGFRYLNLHSISLNNIKTVLHLFPDLKKITLKNSKN